MGKYGHVYLLPQLTSKFQRKSNLNQISDNNRKAIVRLVHRVFKIIIQDGLIVFDQRVFKSLKNSK